MNSIESLRQSRLANLLRGYWHILRPPHRPTQIHSLLERVFRYQIDKPKKLLHIGANNGGEAICYHQNNIEAWHVEAIPDVYQQLVHNCSSKDSQHPIHACLSSVANEQVVFNVASNSGLSSSLLGLGRHSAAHPSIYYESKVSLTTTTVDKLISEGRIPPDIDFMVIDVQGAELLVLQGARALLASGLLKGAMIETAVEPLYDGGATYIDVSSELKLYELFLCEAAFNLNSWCDAIYAKKYWP